MKNKLSTAVCNCLVFNRQDQFCNCPVSSDVSGIFTAGDSGAVIGVFIDRYNRKKIMMISDLLISAASFIMVIAGWMGVLSTELIMVVLLVRSVGSAFHNPCLQAVTPQIVPADQLTRCSGYSQALESVTQILSPVVAAVLYQSWSLSGIIFLDVIGAFIGSVILSRWGGTRNRVYTIAGSFLLMSFSLFVSGILPPGGFIAFVVCSCLMGISGPFYWGFLISGVIVLFAAILFLAVPSVRTCDMENSK